jgi:hypothetical protein
MDLEGEADEQRDEQRLQHLARRSAPESSVVGMMPSRKSVVPAAPSSAAAWPPAACQLVVGGGARAGVEDVADDQADGQRDRRHDEEVAEREPPTLPTLAALRTEPTPRTIVQKMTGWIIILISATNAVAERLELDGEVGARKPTAMPSSTATMTAM